MNYHDARERYRNDPTYRNTVNALAQLMRDLKLTPGEVRDAAALAAIRFEEEQAFLLLDRICTGREAGK